MLNLIWNSLVPVFFGIGLGLVGGWTRDVDTCALVRTSTLPGATALRRWSARLDCIGMTEKR